MRTLILFVIWMVIYNSCGYNVPFYNDTTLCTEDNVCSIDGTRLHDDGSHMCCQPCLCTENCTFGQCCPDASTFVESGAKCKHQLEFVPNFQFEEYFKKLDSYARTFYYVVGECPPNTPFDMIIGCEYTTELGDNMYVHDTVTYTIYKNEMCARCNGVKSYVKWRVVISANETEVGDILSDLNIHYTEIGTDKVLLSVPPIDYPDNMNICDRKAISSCNETGLWDVYDENIVKLCSLPHLAPVTVFVFRYRNVFCALCNMETTQPLSACKQSKPDRGIVGTTLRLLIWMSDYEIVVTEDVKDRSNECPTIMQFKSACRDVICPIGQYYVASECVHGRVEMYGINVEVEIILQIDHVPFVDIVEFVRLNVLSHLKMKENNCFLCLYGIYRLANDTSKYKLYTQVQTTAKCSIETLLKVVREFEIKFQTPLMIQQSPSEAILVTASIDTSGVVTDIDAPIDWMDLVIQHNHLMHFGDVTLKPKYYCASITYSTNEVRILLGEQVANEMILSSEVYMKDKSQINNGPNDTRIICVSDYRRILIQNGLLSSGTIYLPFFYMPFVISCMFHLLFCM